MPYTSSNIFDVIILKASPLILNSEFFNTHISLAKQVID